MNNKYVKEYNDKYGDIPNEFMDRFIYLINLLKIKMSDVDKIKKLIQKNLKIKYNEVSFVFYFTPQATPRPRYSKFTKSFYVKNKMNYNEVFGRYVKSINTGQFPIKTPCEFYCKAYLPIPSSMNRFEIILAELGLIHHMSKPDFDNLAKTYSDMIQKHLIQDDAIIYKGVIEKHYSIKPRIEISIRYMEEFDSKFNKRKMKNK